MTTLSKQRTFKATNNRELIIKHRRSTVILETELHDGEKPDFTFEFTPNVFTELVKYITEVANTVWKNLTPKDATSEASDYYEYYDKEFDNNGYLRIGHNKLIIEGPHLTTGRLYQFNKAKMQSFIYDLSKSQD